MATNWHNADGLDVPFGDTLGLRPVNQARAVNSFGAIKEAVIDVDLTKIATGTITKLRDLNNDGTNDGFNSGDFYFPANSSILSAVAFVKVAAAGGTSIKLGIFQQDGTEIDDDFMITATEGVKANLDLVGSRTYGQGVGVAGPTGGTTDVTANVETPGVGTVDAYPAITGSGTWTAGQLRIVIRYVDILADA